MRPTAHEDSSAGAELRAAEDERALRRRLRRFLLGLVLMTLACAAGVVGYVVLYDRWLRAGDVIRLGRLNLNLRVAAFEGALAGLLVLGGVVAWLSRRTR